MDDEAFAAIRAQIDQEIDALSDAPSGIKMGFKLAGEFLARNLLATLIVDMIYFNWEMRAYRDRIVYPDPTMDDFEYVVGQPG